jgi:glycerol-3-phosphate dehydrogenase
MFYFLLFLQIASPFGLAMTVMNFGMTMKDKYDICIIGGGVVGCAIAREAVKYDLKTALFEKEGDVAEGISKANSGVVHAGFNVKTGSLKARFNIEGLSYFPSICNTLDVPYILCKKLVVAMNDEELPYIEKLYEQGQKNKSPGLSIIKGNAIRKLEPYVQGEYALFSEKTAIISPYGLTIAFAENALANGAQIFLCSEVTGISKENAADEFTLTINNDLKVKTRFVINAAGMNSDDVASLAEETDLKHSPCKGEYFILDTDAYKYVKMAVYPVPPKDGSGLGVHITPTINQNIMLGPSNEYIKRKDDISCTKDVMEKLKREAYQLLPELKNSTIIKNFSGIRPKLFAKGSGKTFEDFVIKESEKFPGLVNFIGIESPGLTSSPAIAKYVIEEFISRRIELKENKNFNPGRKSYKRTKFLTLDEKKELFMQDKNYGEIICRCEEVTKAEILKAINNPLKAVTLNAVKKRTHSMMGRCQGGFCIPRILNILTEELKIQPEKIYMNDEQSYVITGYEN